MGNDYFWEVTIKHLSELQKVQREASAKERVLMENDASLITIKDIGFSIIALSDTILLFKEPIASFYGCQYDAENGFNFDGWTKPTDEEIKKLEAVINLSNNESL